MAMTSLLVQFAQIDTVAQTVAQTQEAVVKGSDWGWPEMLWSALISFCLVFLVLVLLVYIMKGFGFCFAAKPRKAGEKSTEPAPQPMISDEEIAAIAAALKLFRGDLHDKESEVLTIMNIKRAYSPWNSKIHGLTHLPERR